MKKKLIILWVLLFASCIANAGFNGLTSHSRANCINNESISWDWTRKWVLWTDSLHVENRTGTIIHSIITGWQDTWRNAAVHWGEGKGGWGVQGNHWLLGANNEVIEIAHEYVDSCYIYDGWWDRDK